ncbi:MAG: preprotein translocase subunit SecE [Clostridia bacterium]|nr:preprotein translocase subunit SecE [Clostridia bacterium]
MADEKKTVKETTEVKVKKENKFLAFFKNLPRKIASPFKNMWHELKKVTWPTRQSYLKYIAIVLCFMVFMGVVIGLLDMGASKLVSALSSLNPNTTVEEPTTVDDTQVTEPADGETVQDNTATETTEAPAAGN